MAKVQRRFRADFNRSGEELIRSLQFLNDVRYHAIVYDRRSGRLKTTVELFPKTLRSLLSDLSSSRVKLEKATAEVERLELKTEELQQVVWKQGQHQTATESLAADVLELTQERTNLEKERATLQQRNSELERENAALKTANSGLMARIEDLDQAAPPAPAAGSSIPTMAGIAADCPYPKRGRILQGGIPGSGKRR